MTLSGMPVAGQACASVFLTGYQLSCRDAGSSGTRRPPVEGTCQGEAGNPLDSDHPPLTSPAVFSGVLLSRPTACDHWGLPHAQSCGKHREMNCKNINKVRASQRPRNRQVL